VTAVAAGHGHGRPDAGADDGADPTAVLTGAAAVLRERFAIDHATIQVEPRSAHACVETSW
jgi:cobalt-zinc-cadmium efflux system protein